MQLFKIQWHWWEEEHNYLFVHPNKTQKEFKKDIKTLLVKYGPEYLENEEGWVGAPEWIRFAADKMSELGYERVNPITESFWGSYIIDYDEDEIDSEENKEWGKIVGKKLLKAAIEHNEKVEAECNPDAEK